MLATKRANELDGLRYTLEPLENADELGALWKELEKRSDCSFFLSWSWISTWLSTTPNLSPLVLSVLDGEVLVALALVQPVRLRRRFAKCCALFLQQTGDPYTDIITTEYNGILSDRRYSRRVLNNFMVFLKRTKIPTELFDDWDEVHAATVTEEIAEGGRSANLMVLELTHKPSWFVDLESIRRDGRSFLETRSSNTRYQIRRALKLYEQAGTVVAVRARTLCEAFIYFEELKQLHQRYWTGRGMPGGFSNGYFELFHLALIRNCFESGAVELIRISAGSNLMGVVYNFVHRGRIYAYQTGIAYEKDSKLKPGLVSHYLCILEHLKEGASAYDFMAGDSRYKSSLGTRGPDMMHFAFQRKTAARLTEAFFRRLNDWRRMAANKMRGL